MHESSLLKARLFVEHHVLPALPSDRRARVLEIGSKAHDQAATYRPLFPADRFEYVGLDLEAGPNVDLVPAEPWVWDELPDESFDVCLCGQTYEHNPFFWVTFCETARVLRPGGLAFVTAPGGGSVHRYPLDCWRFYPDSWRALCALAGMELLESHFETDDTAAVVPGGRWRDSSLVARRPVLEGAALAAFRERLGAVVLPFRGGGPALGAPDDTPGPCFTAYERIVREGYRADLLRSLRRAVRGDERLRVFDRGVNGAEPPAAS